MFVTLKENIFLTEAPIPFRTAAVVARVVKASFGIRVLRVAIEAFVRPLDPEKVFISETSLF